MVNADLVIAKTSLPDPALTGSNITYTITVAKSGRRAATDMTVTDSRESNQFMIPARWEVCAAFHISARRE